MPAAPSALTTLLGNIGIDVVNVAVHPDVAAFKGVEVTAVFVPLYKATPYVEIVADGTVGEGEEGDRSIQDVSVWIVHQILSDAVHARTMLGLPLTESIATLERVVREAIERPEPYAFAPFNASPYTKQDGTTTGGKVVAAWSVGVEPPEAVPFPAEEEPSEVNFFIRQRVAMRYIIEEDS